MLPVRSLSLRPDLYHVGSLEPGLDYVWSPSEGVVNKLYKFFNEYLSICNNVIIYNVDLFSGYLEYIYVNKI